ncbi:MAG TPA: sensor histidine kinase [Gemmatimonadaceae bacterium]
MTTALRLNPNSAPRTVPLLRGQPRSAATPPIRLAPLRIPLVAKLAGANVLVIALLVGVWLAQGGVLSTIALTIIVAAIGVQLALVFIALGPIHDLERVASRIWRGDFGARVEKSLVADQEVLRIGSMFNILLDGLASDRARMRSLATEVIAAGDRERAAIARELHDSTAQRIAALILELSVAAHDTSDAESAEKLRNVRDAAGAILEEVRHLAQSIHPAVLDDLGLVAALKKLARDSSNGNGIDIDVDATRLADRLPREVETVLYRIAQEAMRNATRHAFPRHIRLTLDGSVDVATLHVHDDGAGFDLAEVERRHQGMGLISMRERVALVDGSIDIKTAKGNGTMITASVPVAPRHDTTPWETA